VIPDSEIERALVITAHPDDLDFGASGTVATWVKAGIEVSYCICTNGDAGGFDPTVPRHEIPGIRQAEQRAAGEAVGVTDIHFLNYHDGRLEVTHDLRRDISRVIRQVRPQRVLCQSPEWDWTNVAISHPDHRAAGEAAMCAVYPDARNPFAHPELIMEEGREEWTVLETWVMSMERANHFVDISEVFGLKLNALFSHVSQTEHAKDEIEEMIRKMNGEAAEQAGLPAGSMAEKFLVMSTA
jgi:LmbE family N-acetylglucosaminyl deacetylase